MVLESQFNFEKHPQLYEMLQKYGSFSISEYMMHIYTPMHTIPQEKIFELHTVLNNLSERILKVSYQKSDLLSYGITSTADHHGILHHPFSLSQNIARALYLQNQDVQTLTTLSCAGISLSNNSYPRGFSVTDTFSKTVLLPLLSLKNKNIPVYVAKPCLPCDIQKVIDRVHLLSLEKEQKNKIIVFLKNLRDDEHVFSLVSFDEQVSYINMKFWQSLDEVSHLRLVYFSQEAVVRELLLMFHIEQDTIIHELIFNFQYQKLFKKYFDNLLGAFLSTKKKGTELFWGISGNQRIALYGSEGGFCDDTGRRFVSNKPEDIRVMLQQKKIMPSLTLTFIVLSFYYGLTTGGGYKQVDYLPTLYEAWKTMLSRLESDGLLLQKNTYIPSKMRNVYLGDFSYLDSNQHIARGFDLYVTTFDNAYKSVDVRTAFLNLITEFKRIENNES